MWMTTPKKSKIMVHFCLNLFYSISSTMNACIKAENLSIVLAQELFASAIKTVEFDMGKEREKHLEMYVWEYVSEYISCLKSKILRIKNNNIHSESEIKWGWASLVENQVRLEALLDAGIRVRKVHLIFVFIWCFNQLRKMLSFFTSPHVQQSFISTGRSLGKEILEKMLLRQFWLQAHRSAENVRTLASILFDGIAIGFLSGREQCGSLFKTFNVGFVSHMRFNTFSG